MQVGDEIQTPWGMPIIIEGLPANGMPGTCVCSYGGRQYALAPDDMLTCWSPVSQLYQSYEWNGYVLSVVGEVENYAAALNEVAIEGERIMDITRRMFG